MKGTIYHELLSVPLFLLLHYDSCFCGPNWTLLDSTQSKLKIHFLFFLSTLSLVLHVGLTQPQIIQWPADKSKLEHLTFKVVIKMLTASHPTRPPPDPGWYWLLSSPASQNPSGLMQPRVPPRLAALPNAPTCLSQK